MTDAKDSQIDAFLSELEQKSAEQFNLVSELRHAFLASHQALSEEIKYGGILFSLCGSPVGGIFVYKEHVSVEFSEGAHFHDPQGLLEGKGKLRRHLKIRSVNDISAKETRAFMAQAVSA